MKCVWTVAAELGEGPIWYGDAVWFVDILSDRIHRFMPTTGERRSWNTPPRPGFIVPKKSGGFIVGLRRGLHDFDPASGTFLLRQEVDSELPGNRLNDGFVDARGRLWFGTMAEGEAGKTGSLYRYDKRGLVAMDRDYGITNGPTVSPDGRTLYHTSTLDRVTYAFDLDAAGGLSNRREFARPSKGYPDGPIVDRNGRVLSSLFGGAGIDCYAPDGKLVEYITLPCPNITKATFGGPDLRTMYVTTARKGMSADALTAAPLAGGLFAIDMAVGGLPQGVFDD